jgi:hypothetical protein
MQVISRLTVHSLGAYHVRSLEIHASSIDGGVKVLNLVVRESIHPAHCHLGASTVPLQLLPISSTIARVVSLSGTLLGYILVDNQALTMLIPSRTWGDPPLHTHPQ